MYEHIYRRVDIWKPEVFQLAGIGCVFFLHEPENSEADNVIWGQQKEINLCLLALKISYLSGFKKKSVM